MAIGILALQGAVQPHKDHFKAMGVETLEVRDLKDLKNPKLSGLVIPGGESTTMLKLLKVFDMFEELKHFGTAKPMWGICAGSILMAKTVENPVQDSLGLLDVSIRRNAYGRQLESFTTAIAGMKQVAFIRAPLLQRLGSNVKVLEKYNQEPVWVLEGNKMASTFHPELSPEKPSTLHKFFAELCNEHCKEELKG